MLHCTHWAFFYKFCLVCTLMTAGAILNSLKTNIFGRLKNFCYKLIPNNAELTFMETILKKIPLTYWITLIYIIGPSSVKKKFPYLLNDLHIYYWSVKTIPLIYWMTLIYIIGPSLVKKISLIYWNIFIYIIGPSSVKKNSPYFFNDPHIYI